MRHAAILLFTGLLLAASPTRQLSGAEADTGQAQSENKDQIVIGDKEKAAGLVAVRARGGQDLGQMSLDSLIERWLREVEAKAGTV